MKRWMSFGMMLLVVLAWDAPAQTRSGLMKQVEGSMLLTGRIDLAADGTVTAYSIDKADQVQSEVLAHIARHVPLWEVQPATLNGTPVASSSPFSMRLLARPHDSGKVLFGITSVNIEEELPEGEKLRKRGDMQPPRYPMTMLEIGATGIVYVVAKVDRNGRVVDSHVERVDLTMLAQRQLAGQIRNQLSKASLRAAREWTFAPPASGPGEGNDHYAVRVPVEFLIGDQSSRYGSWTVYLPGEHVKAPWGKDDDGGNTAAVPGRPMLAGRGMRLVSGLEPGGS